VFFLNGLTHRRFTLNAMAMAYRFFFAVFPGMILIFTLVPKIPVPDLQLQVSNLLQAVIPGDSVSFIDNIVHEFFSKPSAGLIYINVGLLLFSTMGGIKAMMSAFSKDSEHFRRRNIFLFNFVALILLLGLLVIFLGTIALMVLQEYSITSLERRGLIPGGGWEATMIRTGFWLLIYLAVLVAVSLLYYLGPATRRRGRFFSPGAIACSVMILLAVTFFKLFFSQFANYNKVYGSISAIMVLMVWFYWISIVLLIGFELNAAVLAASSGAIVEGGGLETDVERRREGALPDERRSSPPPKK
jgi:membrane protein